MSKDTIRSIYFSIFSSHISNCCQVWGQKDNYRLNKILSLQSSSLRIIKFRPFKSDVSPLFRLLNVTLFSDIVRLSNLLFVFDSLSLSLPNSISNFFSINRNLHHYFTRDVKKNSKLLFFFF